MMFQDSGLPSAAVYVCIYFSGEDAFVAKHLLDSPQIGSVLNQMGGEGMAEGVG